jgi:ABC-2 type transport system permease protein
VGLAEMVAYRTEFLIWILTTNLPLVMMGLWTAAAADGPIGRFGQREFESYYLATLIIRLLTSTWMVWELTMDIRHGALATRLLRPLHPLLPYAAQHLSAVPLRALVTSPMMVVLYFVAGSKLAIHEPARLAIVLASLAGAWLVLFFMMVIIGSLAMFMESALSVFEIWLGVHFVLSGYLVPLELLPAWIHRIADVLPFRYTLSFPVEALVGLMDTEHALHALAVQWAYVVGLFAAAITIWRLGLRRFVAFGG